MDKISLDQCIAYWGLRTKSNMKSCLLSDIMNLITNLSKKYSSILEFKNESENVEQWNLTDLDSFKIQFEKYFIEKYYDNINCETMLWMYSKKLPILLISKINTNIYSNIQISKDDASVIMTTLDHFKSLKISDLKKLI